MPSSGWPRHSLIPSHARIRHPHQKQRLSQEFRHLNGAASKTKNKKQQTAGQVRYSSSKKQPPSSAAHICQLPSASSRFHFLLGQLALRSKKNVDPKYLLSVIGWTPCTSRQCRLVCFLKLLSSSFQRKSVEQHVTTVPYNLT